MAKPKDADTHESFKDSGVAIGQVGDDELDIFPLSELPARIAARDLEEKAWDTAMAEDLDDVSDLDDEVG